jgi:hypothetical protein
MTESSLSFPLRWLTWVAGFVIFLTLSAQLRAQDVPATERQDPADWAIQVTPYVWASGVGGRIVPFSGGPEIQFDQSFSEVLEDLDGSFFLAGSARRGRMVFAGDLTYAASSRAGLVAPGVEASAKLKQTSVTLLAGYSVVQTPDSVVDLMAGLRAWWIDTSVAVPAAGIAAAPSKSFVDPILALRATFRLAPRWSMTLYGDAGGFGIGSKSTWQAVAAGTYALRDNAFLSVGWRHLSVDYRDGGTIVKVNQTGPIVGVTWRF